MKTGAFICVRRLHMNNKHIVAKTIASILTLSLISTNAFAGINLGNDDGTNFKGGTSNNYWGVYTDGGIPLNDTEGLRVTVYDAQSNKVTSKNPQKYRPIEAFSIIGQILTCKQCFEKVTLP